MNKMKIKQNTPAATLPRRQVNKRKKKKIEKNMNVYEFIQRSLIFASDFMFHQWLNDMRFNVP